MMNHYIRNREKGSPFIENFIVTILDEERRELYKMHFKELTPISQSDFRLSYPNKEENFQQYTVSFHYNKLDIEWIPYYGTVKTDGEELENYYDRMIINDPDNNPSDNFPDDTDNDIITPPPSE